MSAAVLEISPRGRVVGARVWVPMVRAAGEAIGAINVDATAT